MFSGSSLVTLSSWTTHFSCDRWTLLDAVSLLLQFVARGYRLWGEVSPVDAFDKGGWDIDIDQYMAYFIHALIRQCVRDIASVTSKSCRSDIADRLRLTTGRAMVSGSASPVGSGLRAQKPGLCLLINRLGMGWIY